MFLFQFFMFNACFLCISDSPYVLFQQAFFYTPFFTLYFHRSYWKIAFMKLFISFLHFCFYIRYHLDCRFKYAIPHFLISKLGEVWILFVGVEIVLSTTAILHYFVLIFHYITIMFDFLQIWRKFQAIGTELVSLAESLSDFSRTTYREKVKTSIFSNWYDAIRIIDYIF